MEEPVASPTSSAFLAEYPIPPRPIRSIKEYVELCGGTKVIEKVLIANNGNAAVKEIRSVRSWAYHVTGNARAIQFVVMATPDDLKANAEFIRMADQFEEVPGGPNNNNYANVRLIVDIAERTGVQAVWAGWGHASENPKLPEALKKRGIEFIGPPAGPMRDLGDKIASTLLAQSANVSTVPWSGSGVTVNYEQEGIPESAYRRATVTCIEEAAAALKHVGYPAMIKASEGGGGKGIRKVMSEDELEMSFRHVQNEVPGSPIFIMKLVPNSHHLEVQILGDKYGDAISIFGRDCSVQRRHQKIIEEGPPIVAIPEVWDEMARGAVRMARAVHYEGAGTIEYLYSHGKYYFLELNPRLQVEHPVTEWISGVNLPAAQLNVAMGIPVRRIPEVRRLFGQEPYGTESFDLYTQPQLPPRGHVIAVRITAENPDLGFKPTSGSIQELTFRTSPNVWGYFSVVASGSLHDFADSQFGHLFSWGSKREEARKNMVLALRELSIRGEIRTPVEYISELMETENFKTNDIHTGWLDEMISKRDDSDSLSSSTQLRPMLAVVCGALVKAYLISKKRDDTFVSYIERGQVPPLNQLCVSDRIGLIYQNVKYMVTVSKCAPNSFNVAVGKRSVMVECRLMSDGGFLAVVDGKNRVIYATEEPTGLRLTIGGKTVCFTNEYNPSRILAMTAGKLARYLVEDGAHLDKGTPFAEVEVMKMYMPVLCPEPGAIRFVKAEGSFLAAGDLIAKLDLDDPTSIKQADEYRGDLEPMQPPRSLNQKLHQQLRTCITQVQSVLTGYRCSDTPRRLVRQLMEILANPQLPLLEFQYTLSNVTGRLPKAVEDDLFKLLRSYELGLSSLPDGCMFPGQGVLDVIDRHAAALQDGYMRKGFLTIAEPITELAHKYVRGLHSHRTEVIALFLRSYFEVESLFKRSNRDQVMLELRETYRSNMARMLEICLSQNGESQKSQLVEELLTVISDSNWMEDFASELHDLAGLNTKQAFDVSLKARQLLMKYKQPSFKQRKVAIEVHLRDAMRATNETERRSHLDLLVHQGPTLVDALVPFFSHKSAELRLLALEVYVRRTYAAYNIDSLSASAVTQRNILLCEFQFSLHDESIIVKKREAAKNRSENGMRRIESADELNQQGKLRYGLMAVVHSLRQLYTDFDFIVQQFKPEFTTYGTEPINTLNIFVLEDDSVVSISPTAADSSTASAASTTPAALTTSDPSLLSATPAASTKRPTSPGADDREAIDQRADQVVQQQMVDELGTFLGGFAKRFEALGLRRITLVEVRNEQYPLYFTFRERLAWQEDPIYRHIEPPLAFHLELSRLSNYDITYLPTVNRQVHLYFAVERATGSRRFFARASVRHGGTFSNDERDIVTQIEPVFADCIKSLEMYTGDKRFQGAQNHHVFLKIIEEVAHAPDNVDTLLRKLGQRHGRRLWRLRVGELELVGKVRRGSNVSRLRFVVTNPTGFHFHIFPYLEVKDSQTKETVHVAMLEPGPRDQQPISTPYLGLDELQTRRYQAQDIRTTYVYDFPTLFSVALGELWETYQTTPGGRQVPRPSGELVRVRELVLDENDQLVEMQREPGLNDIGMVAWRIEFFTPECPRGREMIVISNDITFQIGSFGPREDLLFARASELARRLGLPRVYLSANSGARIGVAQEVRDAFQVAWTDPTNPLAGPAYLYLSDEDYQRHSASVIAERAVQPDGSVRWVVKTIIGLQNDLGVENLRGSGLIAGETSRAYEEVFTITLATGRSVGIGAYLVRLGQRTIQNEAPVILTGAVAINKLLGRDVYTSNVQLGGPQIMYHNGVSHLDVTDDLSGVRAILTWIAYVPPRAGDALPMLLTGDPVEREIEFMPTTTPYDPRWMLAGRYIGGAVVNATPNGSVGVTTSSGSAGDLGVWQSGFFDRDSFTETLAGWAKSVVCGRARLGGIPVAVIAVETRPMEHRKPADPANLDSQEVVVLNAGQVWFPDSAYKTAQAIADFNHGEQLPLIIFANWRGFSGGMRDMFEEILKFGSYIVDNLRKFQRPVFIYIPPHGELRGGAWVVLDPTINEDMMEMYCDELGRGGVLEPRGTVEIKYRKPEILQTMHRLDAELIRLTAQLKSNPPLPEDERRAVQAAISHREQKLFFVYQQVATIFADLHDTPGRMLAKGVIRDVLQWRSSRAYFYWRLRRRLAEERLLTQIATKNPSLSRNERRELIKQWLSASSTEKNAWENDREVIRWLESDDTKIDKYLSKVRSDYVKQQVMALYNEEPEAVRELVNSLKTKRR